MQKVWGVLIAFALLWPGVRLIVQQAKAEPVRIGFHAAKHAVVAAIHTVHLVRAGALLRSKLLQEKMPVRASLTGIYPQVAWHQCWRLRSRTTPIIVNRSDSAITPHCWRVGTGAGAAERSSSMIETCAGVPPIE